MNVRNITTFTLLLLLALGTGYLARSLQPAEITETLTNGGGDGFYLKSAQLLGTDAEGTVVIRNRSRFYCPAKE